MRLVSISLGYSREDKIKLYSIEEIVSCLVSYGLRTDRIFNAGKITREGQLLVDYFAYRSKALKTEIQPNLMDRDGAKTEYEKLVRKNKFTIPTPFNKQKGEKRHFAYLTGIVNILTEKALGGMYFDYNPRKCVVVTSKNYPLRTLSRRVDGTYPKTINPKALWEIKEYYGTTTFGSRVADGVYETLLDGFELDELRRKEGINIEHYLIVDDYFTWWECGKSYLCKIVDMMHEGFVDEVLFGREVVTRWPEIVKRWKK